MSDIKWINIDADIFNNRKIQMIESMPDGDAMVVIWLKLLCLAGEVNDDGYIYLTQEIPYTDEMLSTAFHRPLVTVKLALETFVRFQMVDVVDDVYHISSWEKWQSLNEIEEYDEDELEERQEKDDSKNEYAERVKEQSRIRMARMRERKRLESEKQSKNDECYVTNEKCYVTDEDCYVTPDDCYVTRYVTPEKCYVTNEECYVTGEKCYVTQEEKENEKEERESEKSEKERTKEKDKKEKGIEERVREREEHTPPNPPKGGSAVPVPQARGEPSSAPNGVINTVNAVNKTNITNTTTVNTANTVNTVNAVNTGNTVNTTNTVKKNIRHTYSKDFETFWSAYPKHKQTGKIDAYRSFNRVLNNGEATLDVLLNALEKQKRGMKWTKDQGRFVPNPATWLNQGRWEDSPESYSGVAVPDYSCSEDESL